MCHRSGMASEWEGFLDRWQTAGLLEAERAGRIREWERTRSRSRGLSWPVRIALAFGAILLAAGVLLFVSSHWDEMSPAGRMSLLVAAVAVLHGGGSAVAGRFAALSVTLHAVGSIALGGAIALAGQIFNLSEHWPGAVLLWALGVGLAWLLLKHWTQGALFAILVPWWLAGEWETRVALENSKSMMPAWVGICALSFVYLAARRAPLDSPMRRALAWIGGLALLPAAAIVATYGLWERGNIAGGWPAAIAWVVALGAPLLAAVLLDTRRAVWSSLAVAWTLLLGVIGNAPHADLPVYAWCIVGAAGLAAWGIRDGRAERVNLGVAGLGVTVLSFYFSSVMDKLDRSASLMGIGLLFLGGGWALEQTRRRLLARMSKEAL